MVRPIMEPAFPAARSRRPRMAAAAPLVLVGCSAMAVNVIRSSVTRKLMYRSSGRAGLNSCADSRRNHATAVRTVCEATAPGHPAQRGTHVSECAGRHGRLPCLRAHQRVACTLDIRRDPFQELMRGCAQCTGTGYGAVYRNRMRHVSPCIRVAVCTSGARARVRYRLDAVLGKCCGRQVAVDGVDGQEQVVARVLQLKAHPRAQPR